MPANTKSTPTAPGANKPFSAALAPASARIAGGFASDRSIRPKTCADEVFGGGVSGAMLCCYMIRRFGWPNSGSDSYKDLCGWTLTTPMPGLFLSVTPYLGGRNLHFGVRFNKAVGKKIAVDPGGSSFSKRHRAAIGRWWANVGRHIYTFGCGLRVGDTDTLVYAYSDDPKDSSMICGLWKRTPAHRGFGTRFPKTGMGCWWLGQFLKEAHPEVRLPSMTKREEKARTSVDQLKIIRALKATMRDLLRPTNVRDIFFSPLGDIERDHRAIDASATRGHVAYFPGAGNAPEYWFRLSAKKRNAILSGKIQD